MIEATGRYEFLLAQAAHEKGLPVCLVKPLSVRRFAGAMGPLAKTDKIDAAVIANFAATLKPDASPHKSKNLIAIKDLIARRRQLMCLRTQELNRRSLTGKPFENSCKRVVQCLDDEILRIGKPISSTSTAAY